MHALKEGHAGAYCLQKDFGQCAVTRDEIETCISCVCIPQKYISLNTGCLCICLFFFIALYVVYIVYDLIIIIIIMFMIFKITKLEVQKIKRGYD